MLAVRGGATGGSRRARRAPCGHRQSRDRHRRVRPHLRRTRLDGGDPRSLWRSAPEKFYHQDGKLRYRSSRAIGTASLSVARGHGALTMVPEEFVYGTGRGEYLPPAASTATGGRAIRVGVLRAATDAAERDLRAAQHARDL